jgi:predicted signal transduction protein with EAL and GGDEF domain
LIVSNRRYAEMYGISPDKVKPGMSVDEILRQRFDAGNAPVEGMKVLVEMRLSIVTENEPCTFDVEMTDGRIISILHQPFDNGCWVATHEDMTEQRRHQARIRHLAGHDALTDPPNRNSFRACLEELKSRTRNGETVGVLYIDLDNFKGVNDTLGHAAGDAVLKKVSQEPADCLREGDVVARLGGDEFAYWRVGSTRRKTRQALPKG